MQNKERGEEEEGERSKRRCYSYACVCCVFERREEALVRRETGDEGLAFESQIYSPLTCSRREEDGCLELADYYS